MQVYSPLELGIEGSENTSHNVFERDKKNGLM
jgi:hypothetical protein